MNGSARPPGGGVVFISTSVGAGHNSAAQAVMAGLAQRGWKLSPKFLDTMTITPGAFRAVYAGGYRQLMAHTPWLWGVGYHMTDHPRGRRRGLLERCRLAFEGLMLGQLRRYLLKARPRLIVHTHFLAAPAVGRMIAEGLLDAKQFSVVTDCQVHRFWYAENIERYFVASEQAAETIRHWGVEPQRICCSGIPIHPKWVAPLDRAKLLADWDLPADKRIVILAGGAQFTTGPVARMARELVVACPDVFVVVLSGRNKQLQAKLTELACRYGRLRGVPMTDRAHQLVELCSLMITKAGGITTAECAAKGKPMVFLRPVPGQEAGNARHYVEHGAAAVAHNWSDVVAVASKLLGEPDRLAALAGGARRLYRPATQTIVDAIVGQLDEELSS